MSYVNWRSFKVFGPAIAVIAVCVFAAQLAEDLPSIEQVQAAIAQRVAASAPGEITARSTSVLPRGTIAMNDDEAGRPVAAGEKFPADDQIQHKEHRFRFRGKSYREDWSSEDIAHPVTGQVRAFSNSYISHNDTSMIYSPAIKEGRIEQGESWGKAQLLHQCLLMIVRGEFGTGLEDPKVLRTEALDGAQCIVVGNIDYAEKADWGAARIEVYLDPVKSYLPVRFVSMLADGRIVNDTAFSYEGGTAEGWRLKKITMPTLDPEAATIQSWSEFEVISWRTAPAGAADFAFEFPEDAVIDDGRSGVKIVGGERVRSAVERWLQTAGSN